MNLIGFQVVRKRKPVSMFYFFLASIFINETIYLILTEVQAIITDNAVSKLEYTRYSTVEFQSSVN